MSGGLVGTVINLNSDGFIINSFATGKVTGGYDLGGLVGLIVPFFPGANFTVANSYATGSC